MADLNHDGVPDVVTVNHTANSVSVLYGNGDGTFTAHVDYATGGGPFWVALGDFKGDGYGDIAVTNENDGTVSVLIGNANFRPASSTLAASYTAKADGTWYFHVRAVDNLGVGGPTTTFAVHIDTTPPTASDNIAAGWQTTAQTVTISDADTGGSGLAKLVCTLDGVDQNLAAGGGSFTVSSDGKHTISYYAVDGAGNQSTPVTRSLWIDGTPPITTASASPAGWTNGSVTVTLSASDSGGSGLAATYYKVGGGQRQTYSVPFTVTDATPVTYWSTDGAGNSETANTLVPQIDTTPPTASDNIAAGWQTTAQTVTISDADTGGSGLAKLVCTLDGVDQNLAAGGGSFTVSSDGKHTISYYAVDGAGNQSPPVTKSLWIDSTPPITTASASPAGWTDGEVTVTLSATDSGGSGLDATYYKVGQDGQVKSYDAPIVLSGQGEPTVYYWSTDLAGNSETPGSIQAHIDTTAPVTTASPSPAGWTDGSVTVTLSATDSGGSGLDATYYQIDGGPLQTYAPDNQPLLTSPTQVLSYWSTDVAGNAEDPQSFQAQIDGTPPITTASASPAGWTDGEVTVTLSATDSGGSGLDATYYKVGQDGQVKSYDAPIVLSGQGEPTVYYWSTDLAGNSETPGSIQAHIDTTAPVTTASPSPAGWTDGSVTVTLSATDSGGSGLDATYYQIDGGPLQTYAPDNQPLLTSPTQVLSYWSTDVAGNAEDPQSFQAQIDGTPPITTASASPAGWTDGEVTVTLSATDSGGSGLDATYYKVGQDGQVKSYDAPIVLSGQGEPTVYYWSTDLAGNSETPGSIQAHIDTTAPTASDNIAGGWQTAAQTVTISDADTGGSGLAKLVCTLDGVDQSLAASGGSFQVTADGKHTISYYAVDGAGNQSTPVTKSLWIDGTAPTTTDDHATASLIAPATITLNPRDALSGMTGGLAGTTYEINGGATQTGTTVVLSTPGTYTVDYRSTDAAGNQETPDGSFTVTVQAVPAPTSSSTYGFAADPTSDWHASAQDVTLTASGGDGAARTIHYSTDGGATWAAVPGDSADVNISSDGSHHVEYYASDSLATETTHDAGYVNIDTTAPVTTSADFADNAHSDWQRGPVKVTLQASDTLSGVAATYYQVDGGQEQTYSAPFTVAGEGSHKITFHSVDELGNAEATQTGYVNIDTLPPTSSASGLQPSAHSGWRKNAQTVTLKAADSGSGLAGIYYSIDGHSQAVYTASFTVAGDGSHVVSYHAVDAAGNTETAHVGYVNIDDRPPVTTASGLVSSPDTGYIHDSQQVTLTATDSGCGCKGTYYTLDGSAPTVYAGSFAVAGVGSHTITYYSVDKLGNTEATHTGYVNIAPDQALVTIASGLAGSSHSGWRTSPATVTLTPSGGGGTITTKYRIDSGSWQTYTAPFSVGGSGSHRVDYQSSDTVGDSGQPSSGYVNIDTTPPLTVATGPTTPQRVTAVVHFSASDAQSGVAATFYRIDGNAWQSGTAAIVTAPANHSMDGVHTVSYYSVDTAGNVAATSQFKVRIDTTRPLLRVRVAKHLVVRRGHFMRMRYRARDAGGACKLLVTISRKVHKRVVRRAYAFKMNRTGPWRRARLRLTLRRGTYVVRLRLADTAGNLSAVKSFRLTVK